jgi:hypothetical protein
MSRRVDLLLKHKGEIMYRVTISQRVRSEWESRKYFLETPDIEAYSVTGDYRKIMNTQKLRARAIEIATYWDMDTGKEVRFPDEDSLEVIEPEEAEHTIVNAS